MQIGMNRIMIYRNYSTTILISPVYSIGFCASIIIIIQIISGYILASNYIAERNETFNIVNNIIMRELDTGWLIRYNHINGCGILFIVIYMHMYRTIYYNSISKTTVWIIGVIMYIILCIIAFTGYSLVYGQMSLWAIVVICSLVTAIPIIGYKILILIWGGSVVSSVTLQRIFCVHYILPLIIILLIILHLYNLHAINSTGDMYSISNRYDRISIYPLIMIRDIYIGSIILIVLNVCVYYYSDIFVHSENYIPANPLVTPSEIMPEFYLLPFYALVRAIPNKVLGIVIMILFILSLSNIGRSYYNNSMIIHRSLLIIMVIDIYLSSNLCLLINHNESFYILIIMSVIGVMNNGINSSINSNSNNGYNDIYSCSNGNNGTGSIYIQYSTIVMEVIFKLIIYNLITLISTSCKYIVLLVLVVIYSISSFCASKDISIYRMLVLLIMDSISSIYKYKYKYNNIISGILLTLHSIIICMYILIISNMMNSILIYVKLYIISKSIIVLYNNNSSKILIHNMIGILTNILCNYPYINRLNKCNNNLTHKIINNINIRYSDIMIYKYLVSKISVILPDSVLIIRILILGINMDSTVNIVLQIIDGQITYNIIKDISIYRQGYSTTLIVIKDNNKIINSTIVLYNNNSIISSYTLSKYNI